MAKDRGSGRGALRRRHAGQQFALRGNSRSRRNCTREATEAPERMKGRASKMVPDSGLHLTGSLAAPSAPLGSPEDVLQSLLARFASLLAGDEMTPRRHTAPLLVEVRLNNMDLLRPPSKNDPDPKAMEYYVEVFFAAYNAAQLGVRTIRGPRARGSTAASSCAPLRVRPASWTGPARPLLAPRRPLRGRTTVDAVAWFGTLGHIGGARGVLDGDNRRNPATTRGAVLVARDAPLRRWAGPVGRRSMIA